MRFRVAIRDNVMRLKSVSGAAELADVSIPLTHGFAYPAPLTVIRGHLAAAPDPTDPTFTGRLF